MDYSQSEVSTVTEGVGNSSQQPETKLSKLFSHQVNSVGLDSWKPLLGVSGAPSPPPARQAISEVRFDHTPPALLTPTLLGRDEALLRASWSNLYIMRWCGASTLERLETVFLDLCTLARQRGSFVAVSLLEQGATPPDERGRALVRDHQAQLGDAFAGVAYIVEGKGFMASTIMSVLVGIQNHRQTHGRAERVFRQTRAASEWLSSHLESAPSREEVHEVLRATQSLPLL